MQSGPREGLGRTITREKMQQELAAAAREAQAAPAPATRPKKTRGLKLPLLVRPKGEPTSWNDIPVQHTAPSGASSAKKAIENSGVISPPVSSAASIVPAHAAPFTAPIAATPNMGVRVAPKESILPGLLSEDAPAARRDSHDALTPVAPTHTLVAPAPIIPQPSPASVDAPPVARKKTERANAVTHVLKSYGERIREEGFTRGDLGSDNPKLYSALAVYFNHHPEARSMFPASFFNRKKRNPKAAEPAPDTQRAATDDVPTFPEPSVPFVTLTGGTADASTASAVAGTPPSLQDSPASALPSESSVEKPTRSAAGAVLADAPTFPEPSVHFVTLTGGTADTATVSAPVVEPALLQDSRASFVERLAEEREATQRPEPSQEALERYASSWEALRAFGLTKGYPDLVATLTDSKDRAPFADLSPQQAACALNDAFARAKEETLTLPGADFIGANPKGKAVTSLFARLLEAHAALHAAPAREL